MDCDDQCDNTVYSSHRDESISEKGTEGWLAPMDIANPVSAYSFLSDDAQDEITGSDRNRI